MYKSRKKGNDSNKEGKNETSKKNNINGYYTILSSWLWKYDEHTY